MRHPLALWIAFVVVHFVLGALALFAPGYPLGDVQWVYPFWVDQGLTGGNWVGIQQPWVYPLIALVPMVIARVFGDPAYAATWLSMIMVLDAVALAVLIGREPDRRRLVAGWGWLGFLLLLGPIAIGRIDAVAVPVAIAGLVLLVRHPRVAVLLLTIGAWIKVWPAALVAAVVVVDPRRRLAAAMAVGTSVVILLVALILGSGGNVLSFITQQAGRGLQVEAPPATLSMLSAGLGGGVTLYYDQKILTYQLRGPGVDALAAVLTPLLVLVVAAILVVAVLAVRRGAEPTRLLPWLALALVMAMITVNKVGSPQFTAWIAAPVIYGIVLTGVRLRGGFGVPAVAALLIAGLTQLIYPYLYGELLSLNPAMLAVLAVRNLLDLALLVWAVRAVVRLALQPVPAAVPIPEGV